MWPTEKVPVLSSLSIALYLKYLYVLNKSETTKVMAQKEVDFKSVVSTPSMWFISGSLMIMIKDWIETGPDW